MIEFIRQLVALLRRRRVGLFFFFFLFVWGLWGLKVLTARRYRAYTKTFFGRVTVIIPVVDEPPDVFRSVLRRVTNQKPGKVVVVINGPRNEVLTEIAKEFYAEVVWLPTPSKRRAIEAGLKQADGDVTVLVDSDTLWEPDCLRELTRPFADPEVGGVTTHQAIANADENLVTRFAAWMEKARAHWSMPAMSVHGTVGCLPGRTIAFRTSILRKVMPEFLTETFLGYHPEISDDRSLTNLTLKAGYKTVYQRPAKVLTPAPVTLSKFMRQQYRWSRGSQYNTMMMTPWMAKNARFLGILYWSEMIIPFWLAGIYLFTAKKVAEVGWSKSGALTTHAATALVGSIVSLLLRQIWIYNDNWSDARWLPVILVMVSALMVPIRVAGFVTMGFNIGWGTRLNAFAGGKNRSLQRYAPPATGAALTYGFYLLDKKLVS